MRYLGGKAMVGSDPTVGVRGETMDGPFAGRCRGPWVGPWKGLYAAVT